ncbi:cytochrome P450 6B2-like [Danaus plexippus]|uniref:cytochrome P450 6B2-like n=1 Tax=Danaus plexippus TaxID=13037 RepID=UPI002AB1F35C|nr:cytochrome P450 6B2-like [Danaus plexippus]
MFGFKNSLTRAVVILLWMIENHCYGCDVINLLLTVVLYVTVILCVLMYDYDYWTNLGIFSPPALPIVGHIWSVVARKEQGGVCFQRLYNEYKDKKIIGVHQFYRRTLVICDPVLIKRVCVNDFVYFTDRGFYFDKALDPLAESVLYLRGNEWKRLRAKISPLFSPIKLKGMLSLIESTANDFLASVQRIICKGDVMTNNNQATCVVSDKLLGGYTADAIVPCAFGVKSSVMAHHSDPFAVALAAFYECSLWNVFEKTMRTFWPAFVLFFKIRIIPKKTHDFFFNVVSNVIKERESGVQEKRGDFIDMMMALKDERDDDDEDDFRITDMVIAGNAFIIFLGGFETTSSTLAFLFLELAAQPDVQEQMRAEIARALDKHGAITSDMLQDLTYMDMVIQETLRLYPPFPTIQRVCTRPYQLPGRDVIIPPGTIILFPTLGLHRDEQYFENASSFTPDRWRRSPPPGVYAPFGDGPRYCIGKRFALIQMKCCLAKLLPRVFISPVTDRRGPFPVDLKSPMTLHPADSRVCLSLLTSTEC